MSEPKRWFADYSLDADDQVVTHMAEDPKGGFVKWEDYARLKAEVERLTERNQHLEQIDSYLQSANLNAEEQRSLELEAQVERLTKAGNNLARYAINRDKDLEIDEVEAWNAAKGVQS